jgi:hypothetical protein
VKNCLGLLVSLLVLAAVLAAGAGIWYLSTSAEFSRTDGKGDPPAPAPAEQPEPPR